MGEISIKKDSKAFSLPNSDHLEQIKEQVGAKITFVAPMGTNGLQLRVGHTDRVLPHYAYTAPEWQMFLETCEQLPPVIGREGALDTVQTLLEPVVPPFCHVYLSRGVDDAHTELLIVLDRPTLLENSLFTLLPPPGEHSPTPVVINEPPRLVRSREAKQLSPLLRKILMGPK